MGQIIGSAAKPKRCNLNKLSQLGTPAAGEYILVSSDNSMNAAGQGNFDCYIEGDGTKVATALELHYVNEEKDTLDKLCANLYGVWDVYPDHEGGMFATHMQVKGFKGNMHKAIPITGMSTLQIKANSSLRSDFYLAKSYTIPAATGQTPIDFATGETERRTVNAGTTSAVISIPSDANFLIISSKNSSNVSSKPDSILIDGKDVLIGLISEIDDKPTDGSDRLVESGGVADDIDFLTISAGKEYHKFYQGSLSANGIPSPSQSSRIRTGILKNTKPIHVQIPDGLVLYTVAKYSNRKYNTYIESVSLSRTGEYTCNFNCYIVLIFKKADNSDLTPSDASGIEITSTSFFETGKKIDDAYTTCLSLNSGEAQVNNDYFELGQILLNSQGIPQYGTSNSRVRTKSVVKFYMSIGDTIRIKNGIRLAPCVSTDGEHYTAIGWQTADYTIVTSGYYIFTCTYSVESTITTLESILDNIELVVSGATKNLSLLLQKNVSILNDKIIDTSFDSLTAVRKVDYIPETNGNYVNQGKNYKSAVFPVKPYDVIAVKVNTGSCFGAFVKSYAPTDDNLTIDYCDGTTRITFGGFSYYTAPSDAAFFVITIRFYGVDTIFDTLTINGIDLTSSIFSNISKLSLGSGNADYYGLEKISFDIPTKKYKCQKELIMSQTVAEAGENQYQQGLAIYDGKIFSCIDYTGKAHAGYVYDFETKELLGYIDSDIPLDSCHFNNIQFTDVFYNENDVYPLMFVSQCIYRVGSTNKLFVVRITENGNNFEMTTVKTFTPNNNVIGAAFGATYAYNHVAHEIINWNNTYYFGNDRTENNKTQIYVFKCPDLKDSSDVVLDADDAIRHFSLPFHVLQGGTYKNGMLILPIQWAKIFDDVEVSLLYGQNVLEFIDLATGVVKAFVLLDRTLEPEGCCIYENKVYVAYHDGATTEPDAECFRIESYDFSS